MPNTDLAYPFPDDAVRDYLVTTSLADDEHVLKTNYLKFLGSVFTQINGELEKSRKELNEKKIETAEDLAKWWSNHLEGRRTKLYKAAIDGAGEAIQVRIREDGKKHHR
jgi:malate synthase